MEGGCVGPVAGGMVEWRQWGYRRGWDVERRRRRAVRNGPLDSPDAGVGWTHDRGRPGRRPGGQGVARQTAVPPGWQPFPVLRSHVRWGRRDSSQFARLETDDGRRPRRLRGGLLARRLPRVSSGRDARRAEVRPEDIRALGQRGRHRPGRRIRHAQQRTERRHFPQRHPDLPPHSRRVRRQAGRQTGKKSSACPTETASTGFIARA